jgi:hypothetical protein
MAKHNSTRKILLFLTAGIIGLLLISKCNETFDASTPGSSPYYGKPKLESRGDSAYVKKNKLTKQP